MHIKRKVTKPSSEKPAKKRTVKMCLTVLALAAIILLTSRPPCVTDISEPGDRVAPQGTLSETVSVSVKAADGTPDAVPEGAVVSVRPVAVIGTEERAIEGNADIAVRVYKCPAHIAERCAHAQQTRLMDF